MLASMHRVCLRGQGHAVRWNCFNNRKLLTSKTTTNKTTEHTYISFFLFHHIAKPSEISRHLLNEFHRENFRGTIYIAEEGINGQFSIPTNKLPIFRHIITGANPAFQYIDFNLGESYEEGFCAEDAITFKKLSINVKKSILTDGLSDGHDLNWHDCGREMTAEEWHRSLEVMEGGNQDAILLDCRNAYESDLGSFKHAIPLKTEKFSDSFCALNDVLRDIPKSTHVLTYCTGGIRCVKVNAFLSQRMGYKNVASLKKGIVGYKKWLADNDRNDIKSFFDGDNYVFDRRRIQSMRSDKGICPQVRRD